MDVWDDEVQKFYDEFKWDETDINDGLDCSNLSFEHKAGITYPHLLVDLFAQVKENDNEKRKGQKNVKMGVEHVEVKPYPRASSLSLSDMQFFTYLESRFAGVSHDEDPKFFLYKKLLKLVRQEQEEYQSYLYQLALERESQINLIDHAAEKYISEKMALEHRRVLAYPKDYVYHSKIGISVIPFTSDVYPHKIGNLEIHLVSETLALSSRQRINRLVSSIDRNFIKGHPIPLKQSGYKPNTSIKDENLFKRRDSSDDLGEWRKCYISCDPNAEKLAIHWNADVVISMSALNKFADNQQPFPFEWGVPFVVKNIKDSKGKERKVVFIDSPLPPKCLTPKERILMYYRKVFKYMAGNKYILDDFEHQVEDLIKKNKPEKSCPEPTIMTNKMIESTIDESTQSMEDSLQEFSSSESESNELPQFDGAGDQPRQQPVRRSRRSKAPNTTPASKKKVTKKAGNIKSPKKKNITQTPPKTNTDSESKVDVPSSPMSSKQANAWKAKFSNASFSDKEKVISSLDGSMFQKRKLSKTTIKSPPKQKQKVQKSPPNEPYQLSLTPGDITMLDSKKTITNTTKGSEISTANQLGVSTRRQSKKSTSNAAEGEDPLAAHASSTDENELVIETDEEAVVPHVPKPTTRRNSKDKQKVRNENSSKQQHPIPASATATASLPGANQAKSKVPNELKNIKPFQPSSDLLGQILGIKSTKEQHYVPMKNADLWSQTSKAMKAEDNDGNMNNYDHWLETEHMEDVETLQLSTPCDGTCVFYTLWQFGSKRILIRYYVEGRNNTNHNKCASIHAKLDYQQPLVFDQLSLSEISRSYMALLIKQNSWILRGRIDPLKKMMITTEWEKDAMKLLQNTHAPQLTNTVNMKMMTVLFTKLHELNTGHYICTHKCNDTIVELRMATSNGNASKKVIYDLHDDYKDPGKLIIPRQVNWLPGDITRYCYHHTKYKLIPLLFHPKDEEDNTKKKKTKKKRR